MRKFILRLGLGYVASPRVSFGIPRFTLNPLEALEMDFHEALQVWDLSDLELHMRPADEPREAYTPRASRQGLRRDLVDKIREPGPRGRPRKNPLF